MTWYTALTTGAGLGLAYFGALRLATRRPARGLAGRALFGAGRAARLALAGVVFYGLARGGPGHVLAALAGLWMARRWLIAHVGRDDHGR